MQALRKRDSHQMKVIFGWNTMDDQLFRRFSDKSFEGYTYDSPRGGRKMGIDIIMPLNIHIYRAVAKKSFK